MRNSEPHKMKFVKMIDSWWTDTSGNDVKRRCELFSTQFDSIFIKVHPRSYDSGIYSHPEYEQVTNRDGEAIPGWVFIPNTSANQAEN